MNCRMLHFCYLTPRFNIITGISDVSSINPELTLIELGLDSLMSVEVKQALESYNLPLSNMAEIRQLSINQLLALSADSNTSK